VALAGSLRAAAAALQPLRPGLVGVAQPTVTAISFVARIGASEVFVARIGAYNDLVGRRIQMLKD
jgi:hypothetical protein